MGGRNRKPATVDAGSVEVSSSDLLGSPIRSINRSWYMYEPRCGCFPEWVRITREHYKGKREEDGWVNVAIVWIGDRRHLILWSYRVTLMEGMNLFLVSMGGLPLFRIWEKGACWWTHLSF